MRTGLNARAVTRVSVIVVFVALAYTLLTVFFGEASGTDHAVAAAQAGTELAGATTAAATTTPVSTLIAQNIVNGIVFGLLLALASVGLSLIYGTTGLSNFAHGEQVSLGALLTYFFTTASAVSLPLLPVEFSIGLPLVVAAILAVAISAGSGWLQDKFLWAPLRKRRIGVNQQMIVSIGLSLAGLNLLQWWMGGQPVRLTTAIDSRYQVGPILIGNSTLLAVAIAVVALLGVSGFLLYTRLGRATRAVSDNPSLAAASGIKVNSIIRLVWIMSAGLAALGGILLGLYQQGASFDSGATILLLMFAAVTLGGLGQPFGALVGSLVIGIVAEVSTVWLAPDLKFATALGILIVVLLFRPQGILGRAERVG